VDAIGVLLAAGAGRRYGSPKVLAHDGGWLHAAVTALADGGCGPVLVVLGAAIPTQLPAGVSTVVADDWATGMGASLRAGLSAATSTAATHALVHLVDTPDVGADVVARMLGTGAELARASYGGKPRHPVLLARRHWAAVLGSVAGDHGARDFLRGRDDVVLVECGDLATGRDHDTPD